MYHSSILIFLLSLAIAALAARPSETERVRLWYQAGNTWPPKWQNESEAFKAFCDAREAEIMRIPGADERWENWMQFVQGRMVPKFTEKGFDIVPIPKSAYTKLREAADIALKDFDSIPTEHGVDAIYSKLRPKFIHLGDGAWDVLNELKEYHEQWVGGMKLTPTSAYGIRLYQNGSSLVMHYDKVATHVISSIVHIVHSYDDENHPWPIEIEDHDGNLHAKTLEEGQMLFYESAKCLHGRMTNFRGKYYGSIFLHYKPTDESIWNFDTDKVIANVPPHWKRNIVEDKGSRWAGQAITTDSRAVEGAPPRVFTSRNRKGNRQEL